MRIRPIDHSVAVNGLRVAAMLPLVFEPYLRPQVWGGRRLGDLLHKRLPTPGGYGESWEISAHPLHVSRVAEGELAGKLLTDLWRDRRDQLGGDKLCGVDQFPLLIKYLDCQETLSVQVHPDDRLARTLIGEAFGKSEAWVVLTVEPAARIYAGFRPGVNREEVSRRLDEGTLIECLNCVTPHPGDVFDIPAGTVHALGGGLVVAEVQQTSDATFRLFDWDRRDADGKPRKLHHEQALAAIDWHAPPVLPRRSTDSSSQPLVSNPHFSMSLSLRLPGDEHILTGGGTMRIAMLLEGRAVLSGPDVTFRRSLRAGDTLLFPAEGEPSAWTFSEDSLLLVVEAKAT